ncbi:MAG TPA: hypothetical protein VHN11_00325 [Xanthobacteraceae bacterium]|nr:hypothetical protein [Xanthobacteraceae bacterium]
MEEPKIYHQLEDGRQVTTNVCNCGQCGNEFYVPAVSEEWMPNFCPFCGIKFLRRELDGEHAPYENGGNYGPKVEEIAKLLCLSPSDDVVQAVGRLKAENERLREELDAPWTDDETGKLIDPRGGL